MKQKRSLINIHRCTETSQKGRGESLLLFSRRWCSPGDLAAKEEKEKQKREQRVQK